jgi:hypothetical protein
MRILFLTLSSLALAMAASLAVAQTANDQKANPPTGNQDSDQQKTEHINSQDHSTGNDLSANKQMGKNSDDTDPQKTGAIHGQDSKSGNNLMGNKKGVHGTTAFDTLDSSKQGSVSMQQAKNDPWLSKNFKKCDSDSNGSVSREEYAKCTQ